jgi:hypothetical protein
MKGMQIFQHSLRQITNNLAAALKISGGLYLIETVINLLLGAPMMGSGGMGPGMMGGGAAFGILVASIASLFIAVWIAVAWHRYVLLAEEPTAVLPPFLGDKIGAYFFKALLIGIVVVVVGVIIGMIVGLVAMPMFSAGLGLIGMLFFALLVQVPLIFLGLRMATALPGAAIDVDHGFLAGWEATSDDWQSILQLSVIMALALWVLNLLGVFVFGWVPLLARIWQFVIGWPVTMVGLSVLTTLYGHYIQKRPLV